MKSGATWLAIIVVSLGAACTYYMAIKAGTSVGMPCVMLACAAALGFLASRAGTLRVALAGVVVLTIALHIGRYAFDSQANSSLQFTHGFTGSLFIGFVTLCFSIAAFGFVESKRRTPPPHCCSACAYDLTGNTSGICPECGTNIGARQGPPA